MGAWVASNASVQNFYKKVPLPVVLIAYMAMAIGGHLLHWQVFDNNIHPVYFVVLTVLVYKLAYTMPMLSQKLLKHNDVSYGVYIYHMPVVNALLFLQMKHWSSVWLVAVLASLSWFLVEKPALKLKTSGLRKI